MKAYLYNKETFPSETEYHKLPMAECDDGKHYPVMTPVTLPEMIGEQNGRILIIKDKEMFVLDSQQHLLTNRYKKRKFIH